MNWIEDWVGIPWRPGGRSRETGMDCFGLFVALHRERFGRELYDPRGYMKNAVRVGLERQMKRDNWRPIDGQPGEGDAVLFMVNGRPLHIGYALGRGLMLHIQNEALSCVEKYTTSRWGGRLEGVYTYVD